MKRYTAVLLWLVGLSAVFVGTWAATGGVRAEVAAVVGVLAAIPIGAFRDTYLSPVLRLSQVDEGVVVTDGRVYRHFRIAVRNVGRSAATNCKGYLVLNDVKQVSIRERREGGAKVTRHGAGCPGDDCAEIQGRDVTRRAGESVVEARVCWLEWKERPNATINRGGFEKLEFLALAEDGRSPSTIAPRSDGWPPIETANALCGFTVIHVRVTADNAAPVEAHLGIDGDASPSALTTRIHIQARSASPKT